MVFLALFFFPTPGPKRLENFKERGVVIFFYFLSSAGLMMGLFVSVGGTEEIEERQQRLTRVEQPLFFDL